LKSSPDIVFVFDENLKFLLGSKSITNIININDVSLLQGPLALSKIILMLLPLKDITCHLLKTGIFSMKHPVVIRRMLLFIS
jgi:hypothetical protein